MKTDESIEQERAWLEPLIGPKRAGWYAEACRVTREAHPGELHWACCYREMAMAAGYAEERASEVDQLRAENQRLLSRARKNELLLKERDDFFSTVARLTCPHLAEQAFAAGTLAGATEVVIGYLDARKAEVVAERDRLKQACARQSHEIQQIAGQALGYPRSMDLPEFSDCIEVDCVCTFDETAETLVQKLATKYREAVAERDKLQAFKDWTHRYLDAQGVPYHPPGIHGAEGCRIGDRMDWLVDQMRQAREERDRLQAASLALTDGFLQRLNKIMDKARLGEKPVNTYAELVDLCKSHSLWVECD